MVPINIKPAFLIQGIILLMPILSIILSFRAFIKCIVKL
jgi:hypothetical protein